jgi:hypothetical protein
MALNQIAGASSQSAARSAAMDPVSAALGGEAMSSDGSSDPAIAPFAAELAAAMEDGGQSLPAEGQGQELLMASLAAVQQVQQITDPAAAVPAVQAEQIVLLAGVPVQSTAVELPGVSTEGAIVDPVGVPEDVQPVIAVPSGVPGLAAASSPGVLSGAPDATVADAVASQQTTSGSGIATSMAVATAASAGVSAGVTGTSQQSSPTIASGEAAKVSAATPAVSPDAVQPAVSGSGGQASGQAGADEHHSSSQDQSALAATLAQQTPIQGEAGAAKGVSGAPINLSSDGSPAIATTRVGAESAVAANAVRQNGVRVDGPSAVSSAQAAEAAARADNRLEAARASLGSGALNVEVLKLTRQGGGRAVLEVTPPNQGPIRLDLQLDGAGRASLVIEGLSDSMKARLESTAHFLRQDMAQLGLALNLEMRERNDQSAMAQAFAQGQSGRGGQGGREADGQGSGVPSTVSRNMAPAGRSNAVEDGIHLVA